MIRLNLFLAMIAGCLVLLGVEVATAKNLSQSQLKSACQKGGGVYSAPGVGGAALAPDFGRVGLAP